ncbi:hypothetical protein L6452_01788 [Arctium lappa]|uniref:Uncharacterized protein n=1 Tax=Arctium lappa TaxID=4217 RepID=A0ACB9FHU7_ARCLA|nr:hypothetical protein L6452_01788 [Arctium lappa]
MNEVSSFMEESMHRKTRKSRKPNLSWKISDPILSSCESMVKISVDLSKKRRKEEVNKHRLFQASNPCVLDHEQQEVICKNPPSTAHDVLEFNMGWWYGPSNGGNDIEAVEGSIPLPSVTSNNLPKNDIDGTMGKLMMTDVQENQCCSAVSCVPPSKLVQSSLNGGDNPVQQVEVIQSSNFEGIDRDVCMESQISSLEGTCERETDWDVRMDEGTEKENSAEMERTELMAATTDNIEKSLLQLPFLEPSSEVDGKAVAVAISSCTMKDIEKEKSTMEMVCMESCDIEKEGLKVDSRRCTVSVAASGNQLYTPTDIFFSPFSSKPSVGPGFNISSFENCDGPNEQATNPNGAPHLFLDRTRGPSILLEQGHEFAKGGPHKSLPISDLHKSFHGPRPHNSLDGLESTNSFSGGPHVLESLDSSKPLSEAESHDILLKNSLVSTNFISGGPHVFDNAKSILGSPPKKSLNNVFSVGPKANNRASGLPSILGKPSSGPVVKPMLKPFVVTLWDKKIPFPIVRFYASKLWSQHGLEDVLLNGHGIYLFKFNDTCGLQYVIDNGPWTFKNVPIFIQKWRPGLNLNSTKHDCIPLWVKIHDIPYDTWNDEGLSYIASKIGKPLAMDSWTANMCKYAAGKSAFARVLLEVPTRQNWLEKVKIRIPDPETQEVTLHELRVEYDWKPPMCSHCKIFGHSDSSCVASIAKTVATNSSPTVQSNVIGMDKDGFQTVTRKSSPKAHASSSNGQVEKQNKDKQPAAESGKRATDKLKSKSMVPSRTEFRQVDLSDEEEMIEMESDDGATATFLNSDIMPSQVDPMPTLEPEKLDSTHSPVSS